MTDIFFAADYSVSELVEAERQISNILFPAEVANPRRESLVDIIRGSNALRSLPLTGRKLEDLKLWMEKNLRDLNGCPNMEWFSGKGPIFSHLVRLLAARHILSSFQVDITSSESLIHQLFSQMNLCHPVLKFLMKTFEGSNGIYIQ
jgi:hypothetical protein